MKTLASGVYVWVLERECRHHTTKPDVNDVRAPDRI